MSVNPSPLRPAALACPICGEPIEILEARVAATEQELVEATEQMILMHVQIQHPMHEVLAALGVARNALFDIVNMAADWNDPDESLGWADKAIEVAERGLGHV